MTFPWKYKVVGWISVLAALGLIFLYVKEFDYFSNTIHFKGLLWRSILISLVAGIVLGVRLQHKGEEMVDKVRIWTACLFLPLTFAPLAGSLTNRLLSPHPVETVSFEFFAENPFAAKPFGIIQGETVKPEGYYVFVFKDNELIRLKSDRRRFEQYKRGDTIGLPVKKGLWGFSFIRWED